MREEVCVRAKAMFSESEREGVCARIAQAIITLKPAPETHTCIASSFNIARKERLHRCTGGKHLNGFDGFRTENASSQGQDLALTVVCVPNSLDSGMIATRMCTRNRGSLILTPGVFCMDSDSN